MCSHLSSIQAVLVTSAVPVLPLQAREAASAVVFPPVAVQPEEESEEGRDVARRRRKCSQRLTQRLTDWMVQACVQLASRQHNNHVLNSERDEVMTASVPTSAGNPSGSRSEQSSMLPDVVRSCSSERQRRISATEVSSSRRSHCRKTWTARGSVTVALPVAKSARRSNEHLADVGSPDLLTSSRAVCEHHIVQIGASLRMCADELERESFRRRHVHAGGDVGEDVGDLEVGGKTRRCIAASALISAACFGVWFLYVQR